MKKILILGIFILLVSSVIAQAEVMEDVGITPDSPLYGLENAMKRLSLALTFNEQKKAEKQLKYAQERLREIKLMVLENKLEAAQKAMENREKLLEKVKERIEKVKEDKDGLGDNSKLEADMGEQENEVEEIEAKLEVSELTEEQKAKVQTLIEKLREKNENVKEKITAKQEKIKEKLKEEGLTEEEIKDKINEVKKTGLENAIQLRIEHVKREIEKSKEKLKDENVLGDLTIAEEKLVDAKKEFEAGNVDNAKNLINEALKLAVLVRGQNKELEKVRNILREKTILKEDIEKRVGNVNDLLRKREREQEKAEKQELLGAACITVSPDSVDECCERKGFDFFNKESGECENEQEKESEDNEGE